jgi:hypothetical protein
MRRASLGGAAADHLGHCGMLAAADVGFDSLPRRDHPEHLIIGGARIPVIGPGGFFGELG